MKIGVLGLTGNPIHIGHKEVALYASEMVDQVWICPVFTHAFGKTFIEYENRVNMIRLMFKDLEPKIIIKEIDKEYVEKTGKMAYSYDLLNYMKELNNKNEYKLVIGEDNYKPEVWKKFYNYDKIDKEFGVIVAHDKGLHSTQIREMLQNNENIEKLVGSEIAQYIKMHRLYQPEVKKWKIK